MQPELLIFDYIQLKLLEKVAGIHSTTLYSMSDIHCRLASVSYSWQVRHVKNVFMSDLVC